MRYIIRKVPERNTEYLERLIPEALVYNDVRHKGAIKSFIGAIYMAKDDAVYVQDDMLLCRDFVAKTKERAAERPDKVIVFSNFTHEKMHEMCLSEGLYSPLNAGWLLCTYIPRDIAMGFVQWYTSEAYRKTIVPSRAKRWEIRQYDDVFFRYYLNEIGENVFLTVPNLAGHPRNHSVIDNRRPKITPLFDYANAEV